MHAEDWASTKEQTAFEIIKKTPVSGDLAKSLDTEFGRIHYVIAINKISTSIATRWNDKQGQCRNHLSKHRHTN